MNKKIIRVFSFLLFGILLSTQLLNSQTLSIKWGKEQPYHGRGETKNIELINNNQHSIFYQVNSTKIIKDNDFIVKQNKATGEVKYFDIINKTKKQNFVFNFSSLTNGYIEIKSIVTQKEGEDITYQQLVDTTDLLPKGERVMVPNTTNKSEKRDLSFLAENFEVYGQEVISVYSEDKNGNYYCVNRKFENKNEKRKFINSIVSLVYYPKDGGSPVYLPLVLPNNCFISSYQLAINDKEEIVCSGLYAKEGLRSAMGCYTFIVSPKLTEIKSFDIKEFPKELLLKGLDENDSQKVSKNIDVNKEFEDNTMYLSSKIHFNMDGSYTIVIEKYKLELELNKNNLTTTYHHYYQDIYVINYDSTGKISWMQKIPRYAYVIGNGSFAGKYYLKYDDKNNMYFIFNLIQSNSIFGQVNSSKTVCIKLDTKGNEKFSEIESNTDVSKYICPSFFSDNGANSVVVVKHNYNVMIEGTGSSKNTITFGELELK